MAEMLRHTLLKSIRIIGGHCPCKLWMDCVIDLIKTLRKRYRLLQMQNSHSVKFVIPALVPELRYDDLSLNNGTDAGAAFYNFQHETDAAKVKAIREGLLKYCKLDRLVMVMVMVLERLINS